MYSRAALEDFSLTVEMTARVGFNRGARSILRMTGLFFQPCHFERQREILYSGAALEDFSLTVEMTARGRI